MSSKAAYIATKPRDILTKAIDVAKKINATKRGNNFFEIATLQPRNGVGMLFRQKQWTPGCFFEVTKINVQPDGRHGIAWGIKTWNGKQVTPQPVSMPNLLKKGLWRYIPQENIERRAQRLADVEQFNLHMQKVREQNAQFAPAL